MPVFEFNSSGKCTARSSNFWETNSNWKLHLNECTRSAQLIMGEKLENTFKRDWLTVTPAGSINTPYYSFIFSNCILNISLHTWEFKILTWASKSLQRKNPPVLVLQVLSFVEEGFQFERQSFLKVQNFNPEFKKTTQNHRRHLWETSKLRRRVFFSLYFLLISK